MPRDNRRLLVVFAIVLVATAGFAMVSSTTAADEGDDGFPIEVTDATGETITLDEEPERIVTMAPSAAQTLWELDAEDRVVGVSQHAMFLDGADEVEDVSADPESIDIEAVVDLEPDLVLAPNVTPASEIESLRSLGVTVYHAGVAEDLEDVKDKTETKGELVGATDAADDTIDDMTARLDAIEGVLEDTDDRPLAFFEMGEGFTAGEGTFQHLAIETAGVTNLAGEVGIEQWQPIDPEQVIEHEPDIIIHGEATSEDDFLDALEDTPAWNDDQIVAVDSQNISQPAPRIVDAIETIHEGAYGELEVDAPDDTDPIPGLTPLVAIVAGGTLALLVYRRR